MLHQGLIMLIFNNFRDRVPHSPPRFLPFSNPSVARSISKDEDGWGTNIDVKDAPPPPRKKPNLLARFVCTPKDKGKGLVFGSPFMDVSYPF